MDIQLIRNATLVVKYGGKTFLVDPFFSDKGAFPAFQHTANQLPNPLVNLPVPVSELLHVDAVLVTHLHPDHFDDVAIRELPKDMPIFAQSEQDAEQIRSNGFTDVIAIESDAHIGSVKITRTNGEHGTGDIKARMGNVSGFVFEHEEEETLYIAGDTIWCEAVRETLATFHPHTVIVNSGAAQFLDGDPITMTEDDVLAVYEHGQPERLVAVHMDALNHCSLSRDDLREFIHERGIGRSIFIPEDGEHI
ncbi:MBL fold metallo-hydrolase [Paenalkalicoccus suaedae]|uniref:MBL fold metallo-hydrolase n=1 Tax=Paenalkalicoccus suaedae TaxID=2592382 RepID=A0A859FB13_9BACI|nr:MBL fold metallo-hydrolase [Paenalkalicoccus suaedae]QKS69972.1 MBL fold metallo-hydrolase [Paenalkalicoccus suaedae]